MGKQVNPFKTHWYNRKLAYLFRKDRDRSEGVRDVPEIVRLDAEAGTKPSSLPPVRIFIGTEPGQFRAERVLVWSIKKHRDPARVYEIHLMSDLKPINREGWKTGFTNYRYLIPDLAGNAGRAIYNDVDQIYLSDPAELFDMDMGQAGVLAISEKENSVMLIDCGKMAPLWARQAVIDGKKHDHFKGEMSSADMLATMPGVWNNRDGEWPIEDTKCLHYTTLHTQPWEPFRDQLKYQRSPLAGVWDDLETEADDAGFVLFTKDNPSKRFKEVRSHHKARHNGQSNRADRDWQKTLKPVTDLIALHDAKSILRYGAGDCRHYQPMPGEREDSRSRQFNAWPGVKIVCDDPIFSPFTEPAKEPVDGVISCDELSKVPAEDVPWVLDEMFSTAHKFVYVQISDAGCQDEDLDEDNLTITCHDTDWWEQQMRSAAARCGRSVAWLLASDRKNRLGTNSRTNIRSN